MPTGQAVTGHYDLALVALSLSLAILSSYAALDVLPRIRSTTGPVRILWMGMESIAMGTGIWAMHYVGLLAFRLPVEVKYDWLEVLLSSFVAMTGSGLGFWIVSRSDLNGRRLTAASVCFGLAIASMHYIGMDAMNGPLDYALDYRLVALSILLAIGLSGLVLKLAYEFRSGRGGWTWTKLRTSALMGLALTAMHYAGMAAASFVSLGSQARADARAIEISRLAVAGIVSVTLIILASAIVTSWLDRRLRRQAAELERSQKQLQAIFENMTEGIVVIDRDRNIVQSNEVAARILALPRRSITVREVHELFETLLPDGVALSSDEVPSARAFRGDFLTNFKLLIRRRDTGKAVVAEVSTRPITYAEGELREVMICYRDITDREAMEVARARLAAIVDFSEDAIIGKTEDGVVTSWNNGAEKIFGYSSAEMIGKSVRILLPPGLEHEEDAILAKIKQGETVEHFETIRRQKDGGIIQVSLAISPIKDASGKIVGASKVCRDITSKKMLQRQLQQSQKMEAIGQLTGGVAHDFNNLLGAVIGNLELIEPLVGDNPKALKRAQNALKAASRGAELTRRLLAFSSNQELAPGPTLLSEPISSVLELAKRVIGAGIRIRCQLNAPQARVIVDAAGLENALLNLVVNARDAMPDGGELTISVELKDLAAEHPLVRSGELRPGEYAWIAVSDTGTGMDRAVIDRAFEPFFTTKERGKGTGLGLAMVYGFAKQSGGATRIYSERGQGTTVSLYLPIAGETMPARASAPERIQKVSERPLNIMVVDDEEDLLDVATEFLTGMRHTVVRSRSGAEAIEMLRNHPEIEVAVTDVIMGDGMNGVELARQLLRSRPELKIVFTSGFSADALSFRDEQLMAWPILQKPYQRADLLLAVQQSLEMPS